MGAESQTCQPIWTAGVISDLSWERKSRSSSLTDGNRAGVTFLDEGNVLVYEVGVNSTELSSRQNPSISSPYKLRMSVFNLASGKKLAAAEVGTWIQESSVHGVTDGALVQTGNVLRVYSADLAKLHEIVLSQESQDDKNTVVISSSRTTILVNRHNEKHSRFDVLDGSTLKPIRSWTESVPLRRLYSISDIGIAAADFNQERVMLKDFGEGYWKVISRKAGCVGQPTLVTDTALVTSCNPFSYLSTDGRIIFQDDLGKHESLEQKVAVDQGGTAVAVALNTRRGSDFWDTGRGLQVIARSIVVYSLSLGKRVLTFQLAPPPNNDLDYALSPDGTKLAVLSDQQVTVCAVPSVKPPGLQ